MNLFFKLISLTFLVLGIVILWTTLERYEKGSLEAMLNGGIVFSFWAFSGLFFGMNKIYQKISEYSEE